MKKQKRLLFVTAVAAASIVSTAAIAGGGPILSVTTITPNNHIVKVDELIILAGDKTASGACSPNRVYVDYRPTGANDMEMGAGTSGITSNDFIDMVGTGRGCINLELVRKAKTFSSGNIDLTWNKVTGEYVAANPSAVTLNVR